MRTIDECTALAASDVTVQTTLLEARLLAGRRDLFARFVYLGWFGVALAALAAFLPARKAAKADMLAAIATT